MRVNLKNNLRLAAKSFIHFFYPALCFHCQKEIPEKLYLCKYCLDQLEFLTRDSRCLSCFQIRDEHRCKECSELFKLFQTAAVFNYEGPIKNLLHYYKFNKMVGLAKLLGSLMFIQWVKLDWEPPDLIIPVPQSWLKSWQRGFHPTYLLAKEISMQLKVPVVKKLGRKAEAYSQSLLNQSFRTQFDPSTLILKRAPNITDKRVLLIEDVITTGQTVFNCAALLEEEGPRAIDVLSLALSE